MEYFMYLCTINDKQSIKMEYNEYEDKLRLLKKEHERKECNSLKYVDSNNPYKIGDVVTDHMLLL